MLKFLKSPVATNGKAKIDGAIALFTNALADLNEGIALSNTEIEATNIEIEAKKKEWEDAKKALDENIVDATSDIEKASKIKANIENLLVV